MEVVWLTTGQLNAISDSDTQLNKYFVRTLACDELRKTPVRQQPRAYVVNTDPANKPGQDWIGVWTENDTCKLLDSYTLSLSTYEFITPFVEWLKQWSQVRKNPRSSQSVKTASCGDYAIVYLLFKARGQSIDDFLAMFSEHSYLENDDKVGDLLKEIIQAQIKLSE